jgi:PPK2 family polyphosphate:nucleotide phosphotransferase
MQRDVDRHGRVPTLPGKSAIARFRSPGQNGALKFSELDPADTRGPSKKKVRTASERYGPKLLDLQERLHAEAKLALLIVLQGLDTSGKDGTVRHVISAMNPQGVHIRSFKAPNSVERRHHFLWRFKREIPRPGEITVFNRSYYEDVLVAKVKGLATPPTIEKRYEQINDFEAGLVRSGVTVLKILLHISRDEQQARLLERLDNPEKRWKFSAEDITERGHWDLYQDAFELVVDRCSTPVAPWYVIPSDDKDFRNWAVAKILLKTLQHLNPQLPMPRLKVPELRKRLLAV